MPDEFMFDMTLASRQYRRPRPVFAIQVTTERPGQEILVPVDEGPWHRRRLDTVSYLPADPQGRAASPLPAEVWHRRYHPVTIPGMPHVVWVDVRVPQGYLLSEPAIAVRGGNQVTLPPGSLALRYTGTEALIELLTPEEAAEQFYSLGEVVSLGMVGWTPSHYAFKAVEAVQRQVSVRL
ncbi:hypothetical protein JNJ66_00865 [Candidatus Saccharibacteria bacterium]|nr:hypothetical protein [Candidatus Saccharibacteria bacterium]